MDILTLILENLAEAVLAGIVLFNTVDRHFKGRKEKKFDRKMLAIKKKEEREQAKIKLDKTTRDYEEFGQETLNLHGPFEDDIKQAEAGLTRLDEEIELLEK